MLPYLSLIQGSLYTFGVTLEVNAASDHKNPTSKVAKLLPVPDSNLVVTLSLHRAIVYKRALSVTSALQLAVCIPPVVDTSCLNKCSPLPLYSGGSLCSGGPLAHLCQHPCCTHAREHPQTKTVACYQG